MAGPPPTEDLNEVFGAEPPPLDEPPLPPEDEGGDDAAVDMAIDEAFNAKDPVTRNEAFKNAVRMLTGL